VARVCMREIHCPRGILSHASVVLQWPSPAIPKSATVLHYLGFDKLPSNENATFSSSFIVVLATGVIATNMPVCTLYLLSLSVPLSQFLSALAESPVRPLTIGRVVRWIIVPTILSVDPLLAEDAGWDVLLVTSSADALPDQLMTLVRSQWVVKVGVPSRALENFASKNDRLLNPQPGDVPPLTGALEKPLLADSAQSLELTKELQDWMQGFGKKEGRGAVSMLNLLAFREGMKDEYFKYGKAFAQSIGSRRGGNAKIVGTVIDVSSSPKGIKEWDEVAIAHYPSIYHFADMLASEDYQGVNHRHRVGALKDTFILCTTELDLPLPQKAVPKL